MLDQLETQVRAHVGKYIYSTTPDEAYETVLARRLAELNATVALLETNTRGAICAPRALPEHNPVAAGVAAGSAAHGAGRTRRFRDTLSTEAGQQSAAKPPSGAQPAAGHAGIAVVGTAGADEGVFGKSNGESWLGLSDGRKTTTMLIPMAARMSTPNARIGNQVLATLRRWADERQAGMSGQSAPPDIAAS